MIALAENVIQMPRPRLLGNRVMLFRMDTPIERESKIITPADFHGHGTLVHKVLDVGPGEMVFRKYKIIKQSDGFDSPKSIGVGKKYWVEPEVEIGDMVLSMHWQEAAAYPHWNQPEYLDHPDGRGRCIVDARFILLKWKAPVV